MSLKSPVRLISIIVPTHNESQNISTLYGRIVSVFNDLPEFDFELIFSDDSSDDTPLAISRLNEADPRVKLIRLSRRFSQAIAIAAGIDRCSGDAAVLMDADLQDPPETLKQMIELWLAGHEVVYAVRDSASDYAMYRIYSRIYYRLLRRMSSVEIPVGAGEFRLMDRKVVDFLKRLTERTRFLRGLTVWPGFRQTGIRIDRSARNSGKTNYNFRRSLFVAVDGLVSFSVAPLRWAMVLGVATAVASLVTALVFFALKLLGLAQFGVGWASLIVSLFFLAGVQLIVLGIVGEYIGRIFLEVQNRPVYWVDFTIGFNEE